MIVDTSLQCPTDEVLAARIDNTLDNLSAMYVDEHLNYCARCYAIVHETREVMREMKED
jgi:predicted anti-sigma-YlaC factor YlaD